MAPQYGSGNSPSYSDDSSVPQATVEQAPDEQVSTAGAAAMSANLKHGGVLGLVTGLGAYSQAASAKQKALSSQAATQAADLPTRPGPTRNDPNYHGMTSEALSNGVKVADAGPSHDSSEAWNAIGNALVHVNQTLAQAASTASSGWQGTAANNAMQFHAQVAKWTNTTASGAQVASVNLYNQSSAISSARASMPTPYTYTMNQAYQDVLSAPDPAAAVPGAIANLNKAKENQQQSAQVATSYQQNLVASTQKMPAMSPTPTFSTGGGSGSGNPRSGSGSGSGLGSGAGAGSSSAPHFGMSGGANGSGSGGSGGGGGSGSLPPNTGGGNGQNGGGGLNVQGYNPGGPFAGPFAGSGNGSGPGGGPANLGPTGGMPVGGMPMGGNFGGDGYAPGGGYGTGGPAGGSGGPAGGSGGRAGGGSAGGLGRGGSGSGGGRGGGFGGRGSGFGPDGAESGGGSGSGARGAAGAAAAEDSAVESGAAGARGAGSAGAMGAGRGTGGRKQGDGEHKRAAYLVEADPESIFGTDTRTAPPVIGG